jgi:hypothetical protein
MENENLAATISLDCPIQEKTIAPAHVGRTLLSAAFDFGFGSGLWLFDVVLLTLTSAS